MEIKINNNGEYIPATLEVVDGVMIVSPVKGNDITQFKDGDIITCGWNGKKKYSWTCVLRGEIEQIVDDMLIADYCMIDSFGVYTCENGGSDSATWVRYATEEEKQKLFDALAKEGKAWDAEKKAVVELKWKPNVGDDYHFPSFTEKDGFTPFCNFSWCNSRFDKMLHNKGWVFRTKEECEAYCKKLNDCISSIN